MVSGNLVQLLLQLEPRGSVDTFVSEYGHSNDWIEYEDHHTIPGSYGVIQSTLKPHAHTWVFQASRHNVTVEQKTSDAENHGWLKWWDGKRYGVATADEMERVDELG
jgi:hypothetical protein